jgi:hypothetical protein
MKTLVNIGTLYISISLLLFTGCATVEETLYLRQAEVTGPIMCPPIHLTDSTETPSLTVSPRFTFNTKKSFTGDVEQRKGYYGYDTAFIPLENSLQWDIININAGIDMDLALSKSFAITFGAVYSSHTNYSSWGGNIGIGLFGYKNETAFRFDAGVQINAMQYDAYTVVHTKVTSYWGDTDEYTSFYHDVGESTQIDPYFSLTYNTAFKNWPLNIFINAGYSIQKLFDFEPRTSYLAFGTYTSTDLRGSSTAGFINFTPGIYFFLGDSNRILLGSRFFIETQIRSGNPQFFILPMIQLDFIL